jgi:hypothetical protein
MAIEKISGGLCIDEPRLGRFTLPLAADPISELPVAFALASRKYEGVPELVKAMGVLGAGKCTTAVAFAYGEAAEKVRTNDHSAECLKGDTVGSFPRQEFAPNPLSGAAGRRREDC